MVERRVQTEYYICPNCGLQTTESTGVRRLERYYPCESQCDNCHFEFRGVDSKLRCEYCEKRLECVADPLPIAVAIKVVGEPLPWSA